MVDPKGKDWNRYRGATCLTPNVGELETITETFDAHDDAEIIQAAIRVREAYGLEWLLVTRGSHGMCLVGRDCPPLLEPAKAREVFDVSGAGDTVITTLAAGLVAGLPIGKAVHVANVAAGVVVGKLGTQPVTRSELKAALRMDRHGETPAYALFCCFDLLHPGHIQLLHQAQAYGDRLVVGLNSDLTVQRQGLRPPYHPGKGQGNPSGRAFMCGSRGAF